MKQTIFLIGSLLILANSFSQGIIYDGNPPKRKYPYSIMIQLRNCNKEMRTVTFNSQIEFFKMCVYGQYKLEKNKVLFFSTDYKIDSNYLRQGIAGIKKTLPKNFWAFPINEKWYDNEPNQDSIWFTEMFVQIEKSGEIKIFSAYTITFEGTDARIDMQRRSPKIKDIEFIVDKQKLQTLKIKLKSSAETQ